MLYNAFMDGEELKESFRTDEDTPEEAAEEIAAKMQKDPDTAPDATYKADKGRVAVYRDGDTELEILLEVLPVTEE